jgi:hypothetical protein
VGSLVGAFIVAFVVVGVWFVRKLRTNSQVVNLGEATLDHNDGGGSISTNSKMEQAPSAVASAVTSNSLLPPIMPNSSSSNHYNNGNNNRNNERYGIGLMRRAGGDNYHHHHHHHMDGRSLAGSESEWTVATEAGDSMAIKSIHPNAGLIAPNSPNTSALMLSESFERDRQVAITKDMLTGQWSGKVTNQKMGATTSTESVLQPSYFSAEMERQARDSQQRQQQQHDLLHHHNHDDDDMMIGNLLPDMDSSSFSSSGSGNTERRKKKKLLLQQQRQQQPPGTRNDNNGPNSDEEKAKGKGDQTQE